LVFGGGSGRWGCTATGIYSYYYQQGTEQRFVESAFGECGLSYSELLFRLDYALNRLGGRVCNAACHVHWQCHDDVFLCEISCVVFSCEAGKDLLSHMDYT
jgi:hypothetical protein